MSTEEISSTKGIEELVEIQTEKLERTKQLLEVCRKIDSAIKMTHQTFWIMKGMLNNLSEGKFDDYKSQVIECLLRNPDNIQGTLTLIFEKAVVEPIFCAQMCADLIKVLPPFPSDEPGREASTFKRLLVNKCQKIFEASVREKGEWRVEELPIVGFVCFFGELLKHKILTSIIGHQIIQALFTPDAGRSYPREEHVEAICQIFKTLGDRSKEILKFPQEIEVYFSKLKSLTMSGRLGTRLTLIVRDVLELQVKRQDERGIEVKKLGLHMLEIKTSAQREHAKRVIAEKAAAEAIQKAKELENMFDEESRCKREIEISLTKEKEEHEVCKEERDNAIKAGEEIALRYKKEMDETLAKEKEEHEMLLEIFKKEIEYVKEERDNAVKMTEEILRNQEEESLLSSLQIDSEEQRHPPAYFICPISQEVMEDPHIAADGFTYEKECMNQWLSSGHSTSPMTNLRLSHYVLTPNLTLRSGIQEWLHN